VRNRLLYFEQNILPHLPAAYNLARWLTHNAQDAEDLVQEAYLRAFKFFDGFQGQNDRTWLLKIVRNTFYSRLPQKKLQELTTTFEEELHDQSSEDFNPEKLVLQNINNQQLLQALAELPVEYREVIILRELEYR
jgi:RNA polymerase sigma-70 factor (ECF subfamily)